MADTRFHNRQWENPLKRVTQQNKERLQHQKDEVNAYVEQQSGKIQLMRAAGDAAGRNMDFAVNDFIGAYKKIVDDRADSWKDWSKSYRRGQRVLKTGQDQIQKRNEKFL